MPFEGDRRRGEHARTPARDRSMSRIGELTLRIRGESRWPRGGNRSSASTWGRPIPSSRPSIRSGRPATITNRHGDLSTPSVVLLDDDELIVGKEAQRLALVEPERVAECPKRDMGAPFYHRPVAGRQVPPEVISAIILKRLKADAERRVGRIKRVVITVPAYFDHTRREATCEAARLAGLEVADLLNEPTAAALAYGFQEGFLDAVRGARRPQDGTQGRDDGRRLRPGRRDVRRDGHADPRPRSSRPW